LKVLETERLNLRRVTFDDAPFLLELLNDPSFLRFIGDKGVRTLDDAREYARTGPMASYERFGFGLLLVELKETGAPIGMCGLLQRDTLPQPDIGFAFLPAYQSKGYGKESAAAVMKYGHDTFGMKRILAITSLDNDASIALLERIGLKFEGITRLTPDAGEIRLFAWEAEPEHI
jgi:[ribosomal protein S5]-alanine N-acetyltransferase